MTCSTVSGYRSMSIPAAANARSQGGSHCVSASRIRNGYFVCAGARSTAPRSSTAWKRDNPRVIYGNVPNRGIITNLPEGCCVEVPCLVDGNGVQPTVVGDLPPQLAAMMQTNINVQSLTVEAVLTGRRDHVLHAAMVDPHTAAELDLDQIEALVDELIEAHGDFIPQSLR